MTTPRPNMAEEEYFRRQEAERRRDDAWESLQEASRTARAEQGRVKAAQVRLCPVCKIPLQTRTLRSVEIDECATCRGVWLDAGELEQLSKKDPGFVATLLATWRKSAHK